MRALKLLGAAALISASAISTASAYTQNTHKQIIIDAVNYMQQNQNDPNIPWNKFKNAAAAAGYTWQQAADAIGQGSFDVDDFEDTFLCGAITGDCVDAPVYGIGSFVATYTAWWHFQNHTNGSDVHGNDLGGYDQRYMPASDITDDALAAWLYNDHLDDGRGGMTGTCVWAFGWRCAEDSEYNSYGITEARYRLNTYSNKDMYEDFQTSPYQPIDNLGQYWYNQFLASPTFQTLGFALHTTDLLQPHHVWVTSGNSHGGWEGWVEDNYNTLLDYNEVTTALNNYSVIPASSTDIRGVLTQGGAFAYANGGGVITSTDSSIRTSVGKKVIPNAVAMAVRVISHAANQF